MSYLLIIGFLLRGFRLSRFLRRAIGIGCVSSCCYVSSFLTEQREDTRGCVGAFQSSKAVSQSEENSIKGSINWQLVVTSRLRNKFSVLLKHSHAWYSHWNTMTTDFFYQFCIKRKITSKKICSATDSKPGTSPGISRGGGRVCPGTFLGEVHSPDPHHLPFPQTRAMGLDNTMGVGGTMRYDVLHIRT